MKRQILALVLLFAVTGSVAMQAQSKRTPADSALVQQIEKDVSNQLRRLNYVESEFRVFRSDLENIKSNNEELSTQVKETLERLAQSERAINATLETFAQKFEDQNKTIADVQEVLDSKMNQMLLYIGVGIVAALVLMFIVAKSAAASAVKKHETNWNAFQEHLVKSK